MGRLVDVGLSWRYSDIDYAIYSTELLGKAFSFLLRAAKAIGIVANR